MRSCRDTADLVTAYLEGELPALTRLGIWFHVMMCGHCRNYFKQVKEVARKTGSVPPLDIPPDVEASLADIFAQVSVGAEPSQDKPEE